MTNHSFIRLSDGKQKELYRILHTAAVSLGLSDEGAVAVSGVYPRTMYRLRHSRLSLAESGELRALASVLQCEDEICTLISDAPAASRSLAVAAARFRRYPSSR